MPRRPAAPTTCGALPLTPSLERLGTLTGHKLIAFKSKVNLGYIVVRSKA